MENRSCRLDELLERAVVPSFTRIGYALRSRSWDEVLPSMMGKTVVVTGATSGLGLAAARRLAGLGAAVRLVGRSRAKLERAEAEIRTATGDADLRSYAGDLAVIGDVRAVAGAILAGEPRIDVLVNNAGALFPERGETPDGNELSLATNLLGPFLLTNLLLPRLQSSVPSRIVTVASGGMYTQRVDVDDLQSRDGEYKGAVAYARAKRGQVILTEIWAERLAGRGVAVHAMHPGWVNTPGVAKALPAFRRVVGPLLRTPDQGADTIVWLAAAPEPAKETGLFWLDRKPRPTHRMKRTAESPEDRRRLWESLNELAGTSF